MMLPEEDFLSVPERIERLQESNPFLPINQMICSLMREDIVTCRLAPGQLLNEEQCAQYYTVSRTTIRKAFEVLVEEGWLKKGDNHRITVSNLLREDYLDLMEFRTIIEPAACRLAARCRTREDLKQLEAAVEQCNTPVIPDLYNADGNFHKAVFAACRNSYLIQANTQVIEKLVRGKIYTAEDFGDVYKDTYREHKAIFSAIRDGNEELARRLGHQHIKMMLDSRILRKPREPEG